MERTARARAGARLALVALLVVAGCALPPRLPPDFDRRQLSVQPAAPAVDPIGTKPTGKGDAALSGAAVGAGVGAVSAGLGCLAAGPFAALCMAIIVPTAAVTTAVGTGVAMAVVADNAELVERKRAMLREGLGGADGSRRLADAIAAQLGEGVSNGPPAPADTGWRVELTLRRIETTGSGEDRPFRLSAAGELRLWAPGADAPAFTQQRTVRSEAAHGLADWRADGSARARLAIDAMIGELARSLADSLR